MYSILDTGNAALTCCFSNSFCHSRSNAWIKRCGNNVILGKLIADKTRQRFRRCNLHLLIDVTCAHIKRAAENAGKASTLLI